MQTANVQMHNPLKAMLWGGLLALICSAWPQTAQAVVDGLFGTYTEFAFANEWVERVPVYADDGITVIRYDYQWEDGYEPTQDKDEDGLTNQQEFNGWQVTINGYTGWYTYNSNTVPVETDPTFFGYGPDPELFDTDCDGISDLYESTRLASYAGTNPRVQDTDGDSLKDIVEIYAGMNPKDDGFIYETFTIANGLNSKGITAGVITGTKMADPDIAGKDVMTLQNPAIDLDGDGLDAKKELKKANDIDFSEGCPGLGSTRDHVVLDKLNTEKWVNPFDCDTDGDWMLDSFEKTFTVDGFNPVEAETNGMAFYYNSDSPDKDGLTNFREQCLHPLLAYGWANPLASWPYAKATSPEKRKVVSAIGTRYGDGTRILHGVVGYLSQAQYNKAGDQAYYFTIDYKAGWVPADAVRVGIPGTVRWPTSPATYWTDPREPPAHPGADGDGDGLPDGWEVEHGLNPLSGRAPIEYAADDSEDSVTSLPLLPVGIDPSTALGDPDKDDLLNFQEYFGQDGYRIDLITGTGDETIPWVTRAHNYSERSEFEIYLADNTILLRNGNQAPVDYQHLDLMFPGFETLYSLKNYPGFFNPVSSFGIVTNWMMVVDTSVIPSTTTFTGVPGPNLIPNAGVPGFPTAANDMALLAATYGPDFVASMGLGAFQPFATTHGGIYYIDTNGDGRYTPGVDLLWYALSAEGVFTPGDLILNDFFLLRDGVPSGGTLPASGQPTDLRYFDDDSDAAYTPGVDSVWMPVGLADNYSIGDPILFDGGALAAAAAVDPFVPLPATGPLPATAYYNDANLDAVYTPLLDPVWLDDVNPDGGAFTQADPAALPPVVADTIVDDVGTLETAAAPIAGGLPITDNLPLAVPMPGTDSDSDGVPDAMEIQMDVTQGKPPTCPVLPLNPLVSRSARIVADAGMSPLLVDDPRHFARNYTVEAWVYLEGTAPANGSFIKGATPWPPAPATATSERKAYDLGVTNVTINGQVRDTVPYIGFHTLGGKWYQVTAARTLPRNQWVHLAGTFENDQNALSLYINGTLVQSLQVLEDSISEYLMIYGGGVLSYASGSGFADRLWMDEIRLWGVARNSQEVSENRGNLLQGRQLGALDGVDRNGSLLAYYNFDDGGNVAVDTRHRALSSLMNYSYPQESNIVNRLFHEYFYPDRSYALPSADLGGGFTFDANRAAPVIGELDGERGEMDSDGDTLPDSWELVHELNPLAKLSPEHMFSRYDPLWATLPTSTSGVNDANGDLDGDGLDTHFEYLAHSNPRKEDTDANGIVDGEEDYDGDGLPNRLEAYLESRPDLRDTDDDGIMDSVEQADASSPVSSSSPSKDYALYLDGHPGSYLDIADRFDFRLEDWTVEAKVLPSDLSALADGQGASILRRGVQDTTNNMLAANFDLRVVRVGAYLTPEARFIYVDSKGGGKIVSVRGNPTSYPGHRLDVSASPLDPHPSEGLTHLAASYNSDTSELRLYMNGSPLVSGKFPELNRSPQSGKGARSFTRIGEGFKGFVDDVRIWSVIRPESEIFNNIAAVSPTEPGLEALYTLDDGGWPAIPTAGSVKQALGIPPASSINGDRYLVDTGSGEWAGHDDSIAEYLDSAWEFTVPIDGMRVYVTNVDAVLEYDGVGMAWNPVAGDPTVIRGVDYPNAAAAAAAGNVPVDGSSWLDGANIVTIDSGLLKIRPAPAQVFCEGAMVAGAAAAGDFAWWNSRAQYYRLTSGGWLRWGPALRWLEPARLKVDWIYPDEPTLLAAAGTRIVGERFIVIADPSGDAMIYTAKAEDGTLAESFIKEPLNVEDRILAPDQTVKVWDGTTLVNLALASDLGGYVYIHVRSEGIAFRSDGTRWDRWSMIPTSEDFTALKDWNNQWRNAATLSGYGSFRQLAGEISAYASSELDSDGDGLPDNWEIANNLDPDDPTGVNGALGDPDGDGLSNLNEYLLGYDPRDSDTNDNGINDGEEDFDRDGLPNWYEQNISKTRLDQINTDDDDLTDYEEAIGKGNAEKISNPVWSLDPPIRRSMAFTGNGQLTVPSQTRHHLQSWTLMAWVKPAADLTGESVIIRRTVPRFISKEDASDLVNYELGLREVGAGVFAPYVRHIGLTNNGTGDAADLGDPGEAIVSVNDTNSINETRGGHQATGLIVADEWTHLAGSYDAQTHTMSLYIDGELSVYRNDVFQPSGMELGTEKEVVDGTALTIGSAKRAGGGVEKAFKGWMDDVKVLGGSLSAKQVQAEVSSEVASWLQTINGSTAPQVRQLPISEALQYEHTNKFVLVRFKTGIGPGAAGAVVSSLGMSVNHAYQIAPIYRVELQAGDSVGTKLAELRADPNVLYAEPDYIARPGKTPNDPQFSLQWALDNDGSLGGVEGADIGAPEAWGFTTGNRDVIVAVIDTGVDYTHPDLVDNMWTNPGEIPGNGIDDDRNGYIDDYHGWNFSWVDSIMDGTNYVPSDPMDRNGHGTHVAGIIGAKGNNGLGVAGVNWKVQIMPVSFLGQYGMGLYSDAILAIEYAWKNGARISNNSWGGYGFSESLYDAIRMAGLYGHLVVAAAGNLGLNNDAPGDFFHHYPSDFDLDNVISVAATDRKDELTEWSNYGAISVDLAAPGAGILSTYLNGGYQSMSGTSMAAPFVSGAAAMLLAQDPRRTTAVLKRTLMQSVEILDTLKDKVVTGGRLSLARAVGGGGAPVLNLKFDDGGRPNMGTGTGSAEDFTISEDWNSTPPWYYAAKLNNTAFSTDTYVPAFVDTDNDGMPDWWEDAIGLDSLSATNDDGADGDPDGDGLTNFYEYLAGTNPFDADTNHDAVNDFNADSDGDGLTNGQEQQAGTLPSSEWLGNQVDSTDTDDDGEKDAAEIAAGTDPLMASSPDRARSMRFSGSGRLVVRTEHAHDASLPWTVEAWVKPVGTGTSGILIRRAEKISENDQPWVDYELGLTNGAIPYVAYAFRTEEGGYLRVPVLAPKALTMNKWTHLAAVRDPATLQTRLFVNGKCVADEAAARLPSVTLRGVFETVMGAGLVGELDAVRVWHYVRTAAEIQNNRDVLLPESHIDGVADKNRAPKRIFNFDDGGQTAENSFYLNDWMADWQNAAVLEGDAAFLTAPWPPVDLDSDDDAATDVDERSNNTLTMRSESPYVPRALKFGGLGSVMATEDVDGLETMVYAVSNWTVEAWVKPTAKPAITTPLVRRATRDDGLATFELRVDPDLTVYAGFNREDDGHSVYYVHSGGKKLPTNQWTHLAATYSADDNRLILYINGIEEIRGTDVSAQPVVDRAGRLQLGGFGFMGELKEVRIWNKTRTADDIYANFSKTFLFSVAALENSFHATGAEGNQSYLGRVTEAIEDGYIYDHTSIGVIGDEYRTLEFVAGWHTHPFTLETWIRMQPGAAGGRAVTRQIDTMLVDQGSDWRITEAISISDAGAPTVEWWGQVNIATPIYEEEEVPDPANPTNTVKRKVLNRLEYATEVKRRSLISEVDIRDGQWHHLAGVGDGERIRLYVDGHLETEALSYYVFKARPKPDFETFYWQYPNIGSALRIGDSTLVADLDEVMFWNKNRTLEEVRRHMEYGLTAKEIKESRKPISPIPEFAITNDVTYDDMSVTNSGDHVDLVSYMFFDGTPPLPYMVDAANEPLTYRILPDVNGDEILRNSRPPVFVDRLRALKDDLVGYFAADDGGEAAENFMQRNDLGYAGLLQGDAQFVSAPVTVGDSDRDGLPDWWEEANDLDAGDPDGANGAYGDADGDGLTNIAEYLAGTDPNNWDTSGNGISDYNSSAGGLTFGEFYMDGDQIPDAWELLYGDVLSPLVNDANTDPDGDGWNNLAEYLGSGFSVSVSSTTNTTGEGTNATSEVVTTETATPVAPARPNDSAIYPVPEISFTFLGDATAVLSEQNPLVVWAYSDRLMRKPDAKAVIPLSGSFANGSEATVVRWTSGHVRQGNNIFMAFIDANGDGKWNAGEWMGYSENGTENVQWGSAKVRIALTDQPAGYIRFSWEQNMAAIAAGLSQVNGTTYIVTINSLGTGLNIYSATRDLESMERPYITEMDLKQAGIAPMLSSYRWYVGTVNGAVFASGTNFIDYATTLAAPTILAPSGTTLVHAQNKLRMTLPDDTAQIAIRILRGGATLLSTTVSAPYVNNAGVAEIDLPWLAGWSTFTNGNYTIQVGAINPRFPAGVFSSAAAFSVNLQEAPVGAGTIKGTMGYFGTNAGYWVVEAFEGAGFDQKPVARARAISAGTYTLRPYTLLGLRAGTYHVRSYLDNNGNSVLDEGEAWGFTKGTVSSVSLLRKASAAKTPGDSQSPYAVEYSVRAIDVDAQGAATGMDLMSYDSLAYRKTDVHSDNDGLSDEAELALGTSPVRWDSDFDGLSDYAEAITYGTDPTDSDSDGDGMPDGWEVANNLNPKWASDAALDSDGDGLTNLRESQKGTLPRVADTDGDGMNDGYEVTHDLNPLSALDAALDADGDGLTNLQERQRNTDPNRSDSDGDGLSDGDEVSIFGTNPGRVDSDGDGFGDGDEVAAGTYPTDGGDHPTGKTATTQFVRITAAKGTATVVFVATDLTDVPVQLIIQQNDNLPAQAAWTTVVERAISAPGVYTNVIADPDRDGRFNLRIRTR